MKIVKRVLVGLVLFLAIVVVVMVFWGGHVIKTSVNRLGPQVLGVPVVLEDARFHPIRGFVSLSGLVVGNPEGFRTESLFDLTHLEVDLDMSTLFSDPLVINRIVIERPQITYEMGLRRTNIGVLLASLEKEVEEEEELIEEEPEAAPARGVVIRELILQDTTARVSATALRGGSVPITLGTITLNDLGGEDQSITQISTQIVGAIFGVVVNAVAGAGDLLGDGLGAAWEGVGAVGGRAADGVRAVTGAAGEGARAVTGTVGDGARRLLGRGDDEEAEVEDDEVIEEVIEAVEDDAEIVEEIAEEVEVEVETP